MTSREARVNAVTKVLETNEVSRFLEIASMDHLASSIVSRLDNMLPRPEYLFTGGIYQVTSGGQRVRAYSEMQIEVVACTMEEAKQKVIDLHAPIGGNQQFFVDQITEVRP